MSLEEAKNLLDNLNKITDKDTWTTEIESFRYHLQVYLEDSHKSSAKK